MPVGFQNATDGNLESAIYAILSAKESHISFHLESGHQTLPEDLSQLKYAVSITDPCVDWKTTEELIYSAHAALSSRLAGTS